MENQLIPLASDVLICNVAKKIISRFLKPIITSIITLWLFIKLKQVILFVILFVLNIIFHVSDENYEVKKFLKFKFGNIV